MDRLSFIHPPIELIQKKKKKELQNTSLYFCYVFFYSTILFVSITRMRIKSRMIITAVVNDNIRLGICVKGLYAYS